MDEAIVVKTGTANTASVLAALKRLGCAARLSSGAGDVAAASAVVLPGVGSFAAAMREIERARLVEVLRERIQLARATLCICLGLQVLACESEESPGVRGLGVVEACVTRFGDGVRVPHMGWNRVDAGGMEVTTKKGERQGGVPRAGFAYFANSYKLDSVPAGWDGAWSVHGAPFVAAMGRGGVLACQFHPELSGEWGLDLIKGWLERALTSRGAGRC